MPSKQHKTALLVMDVQPGILERLGDRRVVCAGRATAAPEGPGGRRVLLIPAAVGVGAGARPFAKRFAVREHQAVGACG